MLVAELHADALLQGVYKEKTSMLYNGFLMENFGGKDLYGV